MIFGSAVIYLLVINMLKSAGNLPIFQQSIRLGGAEKCVASREINCQVSVDTGPREGDLVEKEYMLDILKFVWLFSRVLF